MPSPPSTQTFPPLVDQAIVLTGPTAAGKSTLAVAIAEQIGGEILSLDSIAVYRQMDIGTAKPDPSLRARVSHHLIDLADPNQEFSVACYLDAAHRAAAEIRRRGKWPVFAGGTPMFLKAILRGFDPGPPPDWEFRKSVENDIERFGIEALRKRLIQVDPISAQRIDAGDARRMIRALEVAKHTGMPLSHRQVQFDQSRSAESCCVFSLAWPRRQLHQRINTRVEEMFSQGLVEEVQSLLNSHGKLSRTASQAVGYREVLEWIESPYPQEQLQEKVAAHTRQLARRQETWFRSFSEITPIPADQDRTMSELVDQVVRAIQKRDFNSASKQSPLA